MVTSAVPDFYRAASKVEKQGSTSPFSSLNELKPATILISAGTQRQSKTSTTLPPHKATAQYLCLLPPLSGPDTPPEGSINTLIIIDDLSTGLSAGARPSRVAIPRQFQALGATIMVNSSEDCRFPARSLSVTRAPDPF